jgi:glycosyltransferase involved in cell wall biosynthesis
MPARNEAGNVGEVVRRARGTIEGLGIRAEILAIDGDSSDGTREEAAAAGATVVSERGGTYGDALREGFRRARGRYVLTMDSDLSHEPEFLCEMWKARERGDVIVASRYVAGGRAEMRWLRGALSRILNGTFPRLLGVPVRDLSSGFRLYRREDVAGLALAARDFDVLVEALVRLHIAGRTIREIPFHYRARHAGKSNVKLLRFGMGYLRILGRMRRVRRECGTRNAECGKEE